MEKATELNRLRWLCTRRALLELDVLLGGFFDRHYAGLSPQKAQAFAALVEMEDTDLWPLIAGRRECKDALQAEIIAMMREVRVN